MINPPAGVSFSLLDGRANLELNVRDLAESLKLTDLYAVLALSGSNVLIKTAPIILRKAGFEVPLSFDVIILDPELMKFPSPSACTKDTSNICEAEQEYGSYGVTSSACIAMCKTANELLENKPALSIKGIDILAPLYEFSKDITKYTYKDSDKVLYVFTVGTNDPCFSTSTEEGLGNAASPLSVSFIVLLAAVMSAVNACSM
jgi:hypothetical protein